MSSSELFLSYLFVLFMSDPDEVLILVEDYNFVVRKSGLVSNGPGLTIVVEKGDPVQGPMTFNLDPLKSVAHFTKSEKMVNNGDEGLK